MQTFVRAIALVLGLLSAGIDRTYAAEPIPLIDAYSRADQDINLNEIIAMMDRAGISRLILGARGKRHIRGVIQAAKAHPNRITASAKIKTKFFLQNSSEYYKMIEKQSRFPIIGAMSEVTIFYAKKGVARFGNKFSEITIDFNDPRIQAAIKIAKKKEWPLIVFLEFGSAGERYKGLMNGFKEFLRQLAPHPVVLARMGQLTKSAVESLIKGHSNIYFFTAHANPVFMSQYQSRPWTNMFSGHGLAPNWEKLVSSHPKRFILAFENVFREHWQSYYAHQACLWQRALQKLPREAAHAVAHSNAERLWPALTYGKLTTISSKHWKNCGALLSKKIKSASAAKGSNKSPGTKGNLCKYGNMAHCKVACARGFSGACARLKRGR